MGDIRTAAADLLTWLDERAESQGSGRVLPRTYSHAFEQSLRILWRASTNPDSCEQLDPAARDGLRRLGELVNRDDRFYVEFRLLNADNPNIDWDNFFPPIGGDWSWNPDTFDGICKALRLIAKTREGSHDDANPSLNVEISNPTRPMTKSEAKRLMGLGSVDALSDRMRNGKITYRKLSRQSFVFSLDDFPAKTRERALPKG